MVPALLEVAFCQFLFLFLLLYELKNLVVQVAKAHMQWNAFRSWTLTLSADPVTPWRRICDAWPVGNSTNLELER